MVVFGGREAGGQIDAHSSTAPDDLAHRQRIISPSASATGIVMVNV